jgi:enoyl-CoA hydratase/carnithine racemase
VTAPVLIAQTSRSRPRRQASPLRAAGAGGSAILPAWPGHGRARAAGAKRALELAMVGDAIDARTALAWGFVNRVVPRAELDKATEALARAASRGSLASKTLGKRTFYETIDLDLEAAYARAMEVMAESALAPDGRETFRAFLEKRPGVYPPTR